jgi:hypothetical protein
VQIISFIFNRLKENHVSTFKCEYPRVDTKNSCLERSHPDHQGIKPFGHNLKVAGWTKLFRLTNKMNIEKSPMTRSLLPSQSHPIPFTIFPSYGVPMCAAVKLVLASIKSKLS